ncbi:MAG: trypsin-like peptidase domain-containing protein [Nitrospirae bacterium]|nr:trypsin-like peptidase domain-containing protein [Nitrospirota bacterium]
MRTINRSRFKVGFAAAVCVWSALGGSSRADDQAVFEAARSYTVKVRTQVSLPFSEDKKGTYRGAGFVVDAKRGWIATNAHVSSRSSAPVFAAFLNGEYIPVRPVYVDPDVDLAVLELPESARRSIRGEAALDCDSQPRVGHPVGAFGHPWSLSFTGTRGIVSGWSAKYKGMVEMVQTDAPIDPGNSGGPLISLEHGRTVGINTSKKPDSQGSNFALPVSHVCRVLDLLRAGRDPAAPSLDASFVVDPDEPRKLVVARLHAGAPESELREGDEILGVAGEAGEIRNRGHLINALRGRSGVVSLRVRREGRDMALPVTLRAAGRIAERRGVFASGALFSLTPEDGFADVLNGRYKLMVHHVDVGSRAHAAFIEKWDFVVSADGAPVRTLEEIHECLKKAEAGGREAVLKFLHVESTYGSFFSFTESRLPVADVKWIGPRR